MVRRTKIVATVGPASDGPGQLARLIEAGVDVIRISLAHGSIDDHRRRIAGVRKVSADIGRNVAILADLPGPKIRTAPFDEGGIFLSEGDAVTLAPGTRRSTAERIEICYERLLEDVEAGDVVALGDGALSLLVEARNHDHFSGRVVSAGRIQGRPGAHLPSERLQLANPTEHDLELVSALASSVDLLAVSFVRDAGDVHEVRAAAGPGPLLVAKIETRAAVDKLEDVLEAADCVMVARGDLGVECPIEEVPHLQKHIVRTCVAWGRPVITATQMLESMIHSPMPTRAEASDVANAVFDGTDAVMLSAETAIGHDPVLVVRTMGRILARAEQEADYGRWGGRLGSLQRQGELPESLAITGAVTSAAWRVATEVDAAAVLVCSRTGLTARAMARFRPPCPILCFTPSEAVLHQVAVSWGVSPQPIGWYEDVDDIVWHAVEVAARSGVVAKGDNVVVVAGSPVDDVPTSDVLRVVRVR